MANSNKFDSAQALRLDKQLCFSLYSASKALTQAYQPILKPLGLTYPQYLTMLVLWEQDQISVSELGERLFLDSGTLSPLLKKLEARGLLKRQRKATDERTVVIALTKEGQALKQKAQGIPEQLACGFNMELKEIEALRGTLQSLRAKLMKA